MNGLAANKLSKLFKTSLHQFKNVNFCQTFAFSRRVVQTNVVRVLGKNDRELYNKHDRQKNEQMLNNFSPKFFDETFSENDDFKDQRLSKTEITFNQNRKKVPNLPRYEKNDKNHFRETIINISLRKNREKMNLIILEGKRLINDAIKSNLKIKYIYFTLEDNLNEIDNLDFLVKNQETRLIKVLYKDMKIFSSLTTSPGLMAISEKPDYEENSFIFNNSIADKMPLILICDNIRDPGNLGTILRCAASAGVSKVITTLGCVNAWNNKVIKSGAGAHFRIPIHDQVKWSNLVDDHFPENFSIFLADSKADFNQQQQKISNIQSHLYYDVSFFQTNEEKSQILIIGNEAFGLSSNSYELVEKFNGKRIRIPLFNNFESLNSAMASAILIYEMRKQYDLLYKTMIEK